MVEKHAFDWYTSKHFPIAMNVKNSVVPSNNQLNKQKYEAIEESAADMTNVEASINPSINV